eukprot:gb/GEZN01010633.1/.p2 GENE.gb/GEZN01010633.1/~~gb/GEZN01010633.1/.p2  ORF type:complete len:159 (-),score=21.28 gb/GEZN01010633.1/:395-871(-)
MAQLQVIEEAVDMSREVLVAHACLDPGIVEDFRSLMAGSSKNLSEEEKKEKVDKLIWLAEQRNMSYADLHEVLMTLGWDQVLAFDIKQRYIYLTAEVKRTFSAVFAHENKSGRIPFKTIMDYLVKTYVVGNTAKCSKCGWSATANVGTSGKEVEWSRS